MPGRRRGCGSRVRGSAGQPPTESVSTSSCAGCAMRRSLKNRIVADERTACNQQDRVLARSGLETRFGLLLGLVSRSRAAPVGTLVGTVRCSGATAGVAAWTGASRYGVLQRPPPEPSSLPQPIHSLTPSCSLVLQERERCGPRRARRGGPAAQGSQWGPRGGGRGGAPRGARRARRAAGGHAGRRPARPLPAAAAATVAREAGARGPESP